MLEETELFEKSAQKKKNLVFTKSLNFNKDPQVCILYGKAGLGMTSASHLDPYFPLTYSPLNLAFMTDSLSC